MLLVHCKVVKSNNKTQQFFDMKQVKSDLDYTKFIGDQDYVLKNKNKLMYEYFSKELFPNGKVFGKIVIN